MKKTTWVLVTAALGVAFLGACGGPYAGKAPKPPHGPKKTQPPPEVAAAAPDIKWDDKCKTNFADDPNKAKKSITKAKPHDDEGEQWLGQADKAPDMPTKVDDIVKAIEEYKKALLENMYDPHATFNLAVAYTMLLKKGCALKMLERLGKLNDNPRLAGGQSVLDTIYDDVENEPAFEPFRNEANQAIGH